MALAANLVPRLHARSAHRADRLLIRDAEASQARGRRRSPDQNSMRILGKLGFQREGLLRERWNVGDEIRDTAFLGLLAREWRSGAGA